MIIVDKESNIAVILLAAGQSARLGQPKQLLKFAQQSLIRHQAQLALAFTEHVYCVLGFCAETMKAELDDLPVNVVVNENWQGGLSSSISKGVKAIDDKITSVLIVLVDQWQLTLDDFYLFAQLSRDNETLIIAASQTLTLSLPNDTAHKTDRKVINENRQLGPPVLFPQHYFTELISLTGEQGAKPLLKKYAPIVTAIEMPRAFVDIDTPEQLSFYYQQQSFVKFDVF